MDSDEKVDAAGGSALGIAGLSDAVEVARGGFATVYRARQPLLDRIIAVKLIHGTVIDPLGGERFLREVKATGRLSQHPNVAPVYDVGTTASGQPYLIMPFYARGSLGKLVEREGALDERTAVRIGRTLADTLEYVHQHGVLHRDIKPANVLMSDAGEPLLCDFGVARLTDASVSLHTTGTSVVTWAYGPPEAFTGDEPTPAWDIYSLGATMYTLLTGVPPFVDGTDLRERGISPPVADAVRQAMAKAPGERPTSAAAFSALLARRFEPPKREARPEPPRERAAPPPPRPGDEEATTAAHTRLPPPPPPPGPAEEKVRATARKPPREDPSTTTTATPMPETTRRLRGSAVALAVAGAALNLAGATQPTFRFSDETWLSFGTSVDIQVATPSIVLAMTVLLLATPRVAAEWLVGAAAAFLALDYAQTAALTGTCLAMAGTWQYYSRGFVERWWISAAATAGLLVVLLARVFLLRTRTTAAAALTTAGLSGAVLWGIEVWHYVDRDQSGITEVVMAAVGFAVILGVGLSRWLRPHRAPDAPAAGTTY